MSKELDASEIIKPYVHIEEIEEVLSKEEKLTPFSFMTSVSESKRDLISENPESAKEYNAYMVNRGFSFFPDTVLYANELNMLPAMPKAAQYYYYYGSLRKRKRYSKWHKLAKDEILDLICVTYNCRVEVAKQYMKILTEDNIQALRDMRNTGEGKNK